MDKTLSVSALCEAIECPQSTLRAWRNRNGLFPHHGSGGGWTRYSLADALGVMLMVILTGRGFQAQESANLVNRLRADLQFAVHGNGKKIGIGRSHTGEIEHKVFDDTGLVMDNIGYFDDAVVTVVNLQRLQWRLFERLNPEAASSLENTLRGAFGSEE